MTCEEVEHSIDGATDVKVFTGKALQNLYVALDRRRTVESGQSR